MEMDTYNNLWNFRLGTLVQWARSHLSLLNPIQPILTIVFSIGQENEFERGGRVDNIDLPP